jgi:hypothetical protein
MFYIMIDSLRRLLMITAVNPFTAVIDYTLFKGRDPRGETILLRLHI